MQQQLALTCCACTTTCTRCLEGKVPRVLLQKGRFLQRKPVLLGVLACRWLFLIEGLITILFGIIFYVGTPAPCASLTGQEACKFAKHGAKSPSPVMLLSVIFECCCHDGLTMRPICGGMAAVWSGQEARNGLFPDASRARLVGRATSHCAGCAKEGGCLCWQHVGCVS